MHKLPLQNINPHVGTPQSKSKNITSSGAIQYVIGEELRSNRRIAARYSIVYGALYRGASLPRNNPLFFRIRE